jgi:hypothetical protein
MAQMFDPQNLEMLELNRQRRMADLLTNQGMQTPQGQTVAGGIYVPPNPMEYIAKLYSTYQGTKANRELDSKELAMAKALREQEIQDLTRFSELQYGGKEIPAQAQAGPMPSGGNIPIGTTLSEPNPMAAFEVAARSRSPLVRSQLAEMLKGQKLGEGEVIQRYNPATGKMETTAQGAAKYRAPIQIDTGTSIELRDPLDPTKVISRVGKSQMPTAGQVVETANGPMIVNTRTGQAQPIMAGGQPLAPKLSTEQSKDITAINQQRSTINGAIADVTKNKSAFSFGRGLAQNVPYGESLAGRLETPAETETRAYVFNNVSSVIKERAGAAQSAQELQRLNSFLPAVTDNADQIISKLNGFKKYLDDYEKGTRVPTSKPLESSQSNTFTNETDVQKAIQNGTLKKGDKVTVNGVSGTIQ